MRMMMVRFILVDLTTPDKMRPRMDTLPVKGHFLSMYVPDFVFARVTMTYRRKSTRSATMCAKGGNGADGAPRGDEKNPSARAERKPYSKPARQIRGTGTRARDRGDGTHPR